MQEYRVKIALVSLALLLCVLVGTARARSNDVIVIRDDDTPEYFPRNMYASPSSLAPEILCHMPLRRGVCRALLTRWRYDPAKKDCQEFNFGGCDGNENNFSSYEQCMGICKGM